MTLKVSYTIDIREYASPDLGPRAHIVDCSRSDRKAIMSVRRDLLDLATVVANSVRSDNHDEAKLTLFSCRLRVYVYLGYGYDVTRSQVHDIGRTLQTETYYTFRPQEAVEELTFGRRGFIA